jgi:hypothetical protein
MRLVTFARAMAPHGIGDTRLVSDDVAARLSKDGAISASETWPTVSAPGAVLPKRPTPKPARPGSAALFDQRIAR